MTIHNLEQIATLRPKLSNYRGDGSTADYIHDLNAYADGLEAALRSVAPQPHPDSNELTPYMEAILSIGHWDLRYHRLLAACRSVAVSRRAFSSAQSAVLTESLDALESIMAEKPPEWPKSRAAIDAAASANEGGTRG